MCLSFITVIQSTILGIRPLFGPHVGGTLIAISLNSTKHDLHEVQVFVGGRSCSSLLVVIDQSVILCETMASGHWTNDDVEMPITVVTPDGKSDEYSLPFIYKPNPRIEDVYPAKAFLYGGIQQTVTGRNLDSVAFPAMHVFYKNLFETKDLYDIHKYPACDVMNSTFMLCTVPRTTAKIQISAEDFPERRFLNDHTNDWFMTFYLDGIVFGKSEEYRLNVSENPVLDMLEPETLIYQEGVDLVIRGQKLNYGAQMEDFNVMMGTAVCLITHLAADSLRCQPPVHYQDGAKLAVKVKIGQEMEFEVGYLKYGGSIWDNKMLRILILCSVAGVVLLLLLVTTIHISLKLKKLKTRRKTKDVDP